MANQLYKFCRQHIKNSRIRTFARNSYHLGIFGRNIIFGANGTSFKYHPMDGICEIFFNEGIMKGIVIKFPRVKPNYLNIIPYATSSYFYENLSSETTVFIDAGAFPGDAAVAFSKLAPNSHILAFEPDYDNLRYLEEMFYLNDVSNVEVIQTALTGETGTVSFNSGKGMSSRVASDVGLTVNSISLNDIVRKYGLISVLESNQLLLKCDIEGSEVDMLQHNCDDFLKYKPRMSIACYHTVNNKTSGEVLIPILERYGYHITITNPEHATLIAK